VKKTDFSKMASALGKQARGKRKSITEPDRERRRENMRKVSQERLTKLRQGKAGIKKTSVSARALSGRINRELEKKNQRLLKSRTKGAIRGQPENVGWCIVVADDHSPARWSHPASDPRARPGAGILKRHVNIATFARELGVLRPWETVNA
jgi:hypothetical protein